MANPARKIAPTTGRDRVIREVEPADYSDTINQEEFDRIRDCAAREVEGAGEEWELVDGPAW